MKIPRYVLNNLGCANEREFKQLKRKQLRNLRKACDLFRFGIAFAPMYPDAIEKIDQGITQFRYALTIEQWGR